MAAASDIDGFIGRATQQMTATPRFSQVAPKLLPPLDRTLHRLTGGRFLVGRLLVPSLVLTTTGRRSGVPRDAPLACMPGDGGWYVVGSNFRRTHHPAWAGNLIATPEARVPFRGRTAEVVARARSVKGQEQAVHRQVRAVKSFGIRSSSLRCCKPRHGAGRQG